MIGLTLFLFALLAAMGLLSLQFMKDYAAFSDFMHHHPKEAGEMLDEYEAALMPWVGRK